MATPLVVRRWPGCAAPWPTTEPLLILAINTPPTPIRDTARQLVRSALRETLAPLLACAAPEVALISSPGRAIRLACPGRQIGLSASHEAGLSLAALHLDGPVGVDLLSLGQVAALDDQLRQLASDYLGPKAAQRLAALPAAQARGGFAMAWVAFEAGLKCLGLELTEWSPERQSLLDGCTTRALELPLGFVGAVACLDSEALE